MGKQESTNGDHEERLGAAAFACLQELEAGRDLNRAELDARFPGLGYELQDLFAAHAQFDRRARPLRQALGSEAAQQVRAVMAGMVAAGQALGDFRIVREVGRGGMGVVYEAEQLSLKRRVALKVLPFAATLDPRRLRRFQTEAQAAAQLHHTNIVPVYAVGSDRGVPYFAMQFIEGQTLAAVVAELRRLAGMAEAGALVPEQGTCEASGSPPALPPTTDGDQRATEGKQPAAETAASAAGVTSGGRPAQGREYYRSVARLGFQAAEALEHAHQFGVVHRDVKPANLLLDGRGNLWVTDFGLAQVQTEEGLTATGDLVGTLRYMSPEQALGKRVVVDQRTDIYSLGATLYELLALRPAFVGRDRQEVLRQIAFEEPKAPRRLRKGVPTELETIVLKALEKNPADRYTSARELAEDLGRFLEEKPIRARRPGIPEKVRKWARRHKGVVRSAMVALLVVAAALAVSVVLTNAAYQSEATQHQRAEKQRQRAEDERQRAEDERDQSRHHLYDARFHLARFAWQDNDFVRIQGLLDPYVPAVGQPDLRGWEWFYLQFRSRTGFFMLHEPGRFVNQMAWSPDGRFIATSEVEKTKDAQPPTVLTRIRDSLSGQSILELPVSTGQAGSYLAWSPDGQSLATSGPSGFMVWDTRKGREVFGWKVLREGDAYPMLAWSPDGRLLACVAGGKVTVWDAKAGKRLLTPAQAIGWCMSLAWAPDSKRLSCAGNFATAHYTNATRSNLSARAWNVSTGQELFSAPIHLNTPWMSQREGTTVAWSPDRERVAVEGGGRSIKIYGVKAKKELLTLSDLTADCMAWSPQGDWLAATETDKIRIYQASTGQLLKTLTGHKEKIWHMAWQPRSRLLATSAADSTIRVWDVTSGKEIACRRGDSGSLTWSPDGARLATFGRSLSVWAPAINLDPYRLRISVDDRQMLWYPDSERLILTDWRDASIKLIDIGSGEVDLRLPRFGEPLIQAQSIALSPDGRWLASSGQIVTRIEGDPATARETRAMGPSVLLIWDMTTGREPRSLGHPDWQSYLGRVAWSPDGTRVAAEMHEWDEKQFVHFLQIWDTRNWQELVRSPVDVKSIEQVRLQGDPTTFFTLIWSPDSKQLASADCQDGTIKIWERDTSKLVRMLPGCGPARNGSSNLRDLVAWSPDGCWLAAAGPNYEIQIYDALTWQDRGTLHGHSANIYTVYWSPDGKRIASASDDHSVRIWNARTREELYIFRGSQPWSPERLAWSPDGKRLATRLDRETIDIWDASGHYTKSIRATAQNALAWFLANSPDARVRNPADAVKLAQESVALRPSKAEGWNTLGVAHFRHGDWKAAVAALEKSMELRNGGNSFDWFFLAMACSQLGDMEKARKWYDQAVGWMEKNKSQDEELRRFRAEAAEVFGPKEKKD